MTGRSPGRVAVRGLLEGSPLTVSGRLRRVVGLEAEVSGLRAAIGELVQIRRDGAPPVPAEVVALRDRDLVVVPYGDLEGIAPGAEVRLAGDRLPLRVGPALIGRVVDALGRPIDGRGPIDGETVPLHSPPPGPLDRRRITEPLPLGVRAVDTLLTCARGQRMGIFAGSGVGKSTLLGMFARGASADVVVVGLVGERGREVREFLEEDLAGGAERAVVVVATSDEPALMRLRAAFCATRIAEWFADRGADVLLLVDSLTRVAMAQREVGLAAGEPPATRGYPPSVFAMMPRLLERAGPRTQGTITGLYTVLVEGDDLNEPVCDHARSILDGHIVLSRRLAAAGHYPTIDVLESTSRLAGRILEPDRLAAAARLRALLAAWEDSRDLVEIGAYAPGTNPDTDEFLARRSAIEGFLRQPVAEVAPWEDSWRRLTSLVTGPVTGPPAPPVPSGGGERP